jgi:hypothetical protein
MLPSRYDPMILRHVRYEANVDKGLQSASPAVHEHDRGSGANIDVLYSNAIRGGVFVCTGRGRRCTHKDHDRRRDGPTSDVRRTSLDGNRLSNVRGHTRSANYYLDCTGTVALHPYHQQTRSLTRIPATRLPKYARPGRNGNACESRHSRAAAHRRPCGGRKSSMPWSRSGLTRGSGVISSRPLYISMAGRCRESRSRSRRNSRPKLIEAAAP